MQYSPRPSKAIKYHFLLTSNNKQKCPDFFNFQNTLLICINFTTFMKDNKDYQYALQQDWFFLVINNRLVDSIFVPLNQIQGCISYRTLFLSLQCFNIQLFGFRSESLGTLLLFLLGYLVLSIHKCILSVHMFLAKGIHLKRINVK